MEVIIDGVVHSLSKNTFTTTALFNEATLITNFTEIIPGEGYYLKFYVEDAKVILNGTPNSIITFYGNDYQNVLGDDNIILNIKGGELSLRNPKINVNGVGRFRSIYAYKELQNSIRSLGDDCQVKGTFTFEGIYGDVYSIANNFNLHGTVETSNNIYDFDEWNYFIKSIPYLFVALPLMIVVYLYDRKQEKHL